MDSAKDGGGFDAAPPPVAGLGNFKGVMLCNRPVDNPSSQFGGGDGPQPFKSMVSGSHGEQLGLTPCRNFEPTVKKRGPSAALRRHVQWLKELQNQMKEEREQVDAEETEMQAREERMKATFHQHREGVRQMLKERNETLDAEEERLKMEKRAKREAEKAAKLAKKNGGTAPAKPMWAMTEEEKEEFEEGEADELISFAENLDFDKFIGDMEFRQGLDSLRDRAGKLKREQEAFKDALVRDFNAMREEEDRSTSVGSPRNLEDGLDGQSYFGDQKLGSEYSTGSRRSRGMERYGADGTLDWDSSTACGEEKQIDPELRDMAEAVLESNTNMRGVHSKGSVQKIIEKARERQAVEPPPAKDIFEMMLREGPAPVPVITASADTQNRLHKPPDPSLLPYLYRSPAI